MRKLLLVFSLILCLHLSGQSITGVWYGYFIISNKGLIHKEPSVQYNYEVQMLEKSNGQLTGVTYAYKTKTYFGKANCKGSVSGNRKSVVITETAITAVEKKDNTDDCVMVCNLQYIITNTGEELLRGTFTSKNTKNKSSCFSGEVLLRRVLKPVFPLEEFLKREPASVNSKPPIPKVADTGSLKKSQLVPKKKYLLELPEEEVLTKQPKNVQQEAIKTPAEILQRENALLATVLQPEQEVTVFIYDNGIVDNDLVSVFVDANKVFNKVPLSEKAISFTLTFSETITQHQIVTYAENLGDVPPNTGLLVIKAGKKMIEIPIMSDFQKNAKIIINYQANCKVAVERFN